jgi:ankyrin repeat protein
MAQLCFNGGSMEAKDQFGNTALDYAARAGSAAHIQVISQMLVGRQELHADLIKGALLVGNDAALGELFRLAPDAVKHRVIVDVAVARHYSLSRLASVAGFDFKVIGNDGKTAAQTLVSRIQDAVAQGGEDRAARKEIFGIVCLADCGASIDDAVLHDVLKGALTTAARFDSNATNIRFLMKSSLWKRCDTLAKNFLDAQAVQMRQGTLSECEAGFKAAKNLVVAGVIPNEKTGRDILEMASARRDSTLIKQLAEYGFEPTPEAPRRAPPAGPAYRAHEAYSERDIDMYVGLMKSAIGLPDRRSLLQMYQAAPAHVKHRLLVEVAMDKRYSLRRLVALTGGDFHLHDAEGKTPAQALARRIEEAVRQGIEPGTATLELFGIVRMADRGAPIDDAVLGVALEAALLTAARRELNACNIQYLMNSSLGKRCKGRAQEFLADCVRGIGQGSMRKRMAAFDSAKRLLLAGLAPDEPVARALLKAAAQLQDEMLINKLAELGITQTSPDLFETIREGDVQQLKQHLAEGADLHQKDPQGNTLLHAAILRGDVAMVKALGQFGPHYLEEDSARRTPIALAQTSGTEQIEDALQAAALGLPEIPQSRQDALKAFKQQALNWHPDKKPDAPRQMMQLVNAARDYWFARAI